MDRLVAMCATMMTVGTWEGASPSGLLGGVLQCQWVTGWLGAGSEGSRTKTCAMARLLATGAMVDVEEAAVNWLDSRGLFDGGGARLPLCRDSHRNSGEGARVRGGLMPRQ